MNFAGATAAAQVQAITNEFYAGDQLDYSFTLNSGKTVVPAVTTNFTLTTLAVYTTLFSAGQTTQSYSHTLAGQGTFLIEAGHTDLTAGLEPRTSVLTVTCTPGDTPVILTVGASPASTTYGQNATFTATLTAADGGTPTGNVVFMIDGVAQAPVAAAGGVATLVTSALDAGNHTISASYAGAVGFTAAAGALGGLYEVATATSSTSLTFAPPGPVVGDTITLTATVSSGGGTPDGSVIFTIDGVPQAPVALAGGVGILNIPANTIGTTNTSVIYSGSSNFAASSSANVAISVGPAVPVSITGGALPNGVLGAPYTRVIAGSDGAPPLTYAVTAGSLPIGLTLAADGTLSGTPTVGGTYNFTITVTDNGAASDSAAFTLFIDAAGGAWIEPWQQIEANSDSQMSVSATFGGHTYTSANIASIDPTGAGTASISVEGGNVVIRFMPYANFRGDARITYLMHSATQTQQLSVLFTVTVMSAITMPNGVSQMLHGQNMTTAGFSGVQANNFSRRIQSLHGNGARRNDLALTLVDKDGTAFTITLPESKAPPPALRGSLDPREGTTRKRISWWSSGQVTVGEEAGSFRFTTSGVSLGADYPLNPDFDVGVGIGAAKNITGSVEVQSDYVSLFASAYFSYRPQPNTFVDSVFGVGRTHLNVTRLLPSGNKAKGSRLGDQAFVSLKAGYHHDVGKFRLTPYGKLGFSAHRLSPYTETGGLPGEAIDYAEQFAWQLNHHIGTRLDWDMPLRRGILTPGIHIQFGQNRSRLDGSSITLAGIPDSPAFNWASTSSTNIFGEIGATAGFTFPGGGRFSLDLLYTLTATNSRAGTLRLYAAGTLH